MTRICHAISSALPAGIPGPARSGNDFNFVWPWDALAILPYRASSTNGELMKEPSPESSAGFRPCAKNSAQVLVEWVNTWMFAVVIRTRLQLLT